MNSGVGPKKELEKVNVPVVHDLPGVGENLHNHVSFGLSFTMDEPNNNTLNWASAMEYLTEGKGPMSGTGKHITLFFGPRDFGKFAYK